MLRLVSFSTWNFFLTTILKLKVRETDECSTYICCECLGQLQLAHDIRRKCLDSYQRLRGVSLRKKHENDILDAIIDEPPEHDSHDKPIKIEESDEQIMTLNSNDDEPSDEQGVKTRQPMPTHEKFQCSVCGKTFDTAGHLRSHELTHNESKDFTCHCGKQFLTKSYLNRHMKSHMNQRNYVCKVCQKGFNTSTSLKYHFRLVHSGETNFHCSYCNKGFALKIQLVSHTR